jgi:hypothetical protein
MHVNSLTNKEKKHTKKDTAEREGYVKFTRASPGERSEEWGPHQKNAHKKVPTLTQLVSSFAMIRSY